MNIADKIRIEKITEPYWVEEKGADAISRAIDDTYEDLISFNIDYAGTAVLTPVNQVIYVEPWMDECLRAAMNTKLRPIEYPDRVTSRNRLKLIEALHTDIVKNIEPVLEGYGIVLTMDYVKFVGTMLDIPDYYWSILVFDVDYSFKDRKGYIEVGDY